MFFRIAMLPLAACLAVATAFGPPSYDSGNIGREPKNHEYRPAKKTDSRSPCPGLNAMANHGFLPRNGRDISYPTLRDAALGAYGYTPDTYQIFFLLTAQSNLFNLSSTSTPSTTFNLEDLKAHRTIEQDGSLSRNDCGVNGDDLNFSPAVWNPVAKALGVGPGSDLSGYVSNKTAAEAYIARQIAARKANPSFVAGCDQRNGTQGTTSLYLATLWDFEARAVPKGWIEPFFGKNYVFLGMCMPADFGGIVEERIPYKEGYMASRPKDVNFIHEFVVSVNDLVNEIGGLEYFDPDHCTPYVPAGPTHPPCKRG